MLGRGKIVRPVRERGGEAPATETAFLVSFLSLGFIFSYVYIWEVYAHE